MTSLEEILPLVLLSAVFANLANWSCRPVGVLLVTPSQGWMRNILLGWMLAVCLLAMGGVLGFPRGRAFMLIGPLGVILHNGYSLRVRLQQQSAAT